MKGVCLCGSVTIESKNISEFEACHCGMCRRWGGGPFLAVHCDSGIKINGQDTITNYASSEWAERGFCNNCGTHLYYHLKPTDEYIVPVGLFESSDGFSFSKQIFIDQKPDYYNFANKTQELTEQEVFEKAGV